MKIQLSNVIRGRNANANYPQEYVRRSVIASNGVKCSAKETCRHENNNRSNWADRQNVWERERKNVRERHRQQESERETHPPAAREEAHHMLICICFACFALFTFTSCLFPSPNSLFLRWSNVKRIVLFGADALRVDEGLFGDIDVLSVDVRVIEAVIKTLQGSGQATIRNSIVTLLQHIVWVCSRNCGICDTQLG